MNADIMMFQYCECLAGELQIFFKSEVRVRGIRDGDDGAGRDLFYFSRQALDEIFFRPRPRKIPYIGRCVTVEAAVGASRIR